MGFFFLHQNKVWLRLLKTLSVSVDSCWLYLQWKNHQNQNFWNLTSALWGGRMETTENQTVRFRWDSLSASCWWSGPTLTAPWLARGELQCLIKLSPQRFKRKAEETCPAGRALGAIETLHRAPLFIWKRHPALMKLLRDSHLLLLCPVLWITRLRSSVSTVYKIEIVNVFRRGCEVCVMSLCTLASYLGIPNN